MPQAQGLANYVQTTLSVGCTNATTVLTLTSVAGLPTFGNFRLRIDDVAPATTFEIVEVTSVNVGAGQVTATRGMENTTPIAHNAGAIVGNDLTAAMLSLATAAGAAAYAQVTANQGGITTEVALTSLTFSVQTLAARRYRISWNMMVQTTVAGDVVALQLKEDGTVIAQDWQILSGTGNQSLHGFTIRTPVFTVHTYLLTLQRNSGTGTITMNAAATNPAFLSIEDIGT